jgi:membrane protein
VSLAPLLLVAIGISGLLFDRTRLTGGLVAEMEGLIGHDGAALFASVLKSPDQPKQATLATIFGSLTLLFGATAVFVELQDGLNAVWNVDKTKTKGIWGFIRTRLLSAAMVVSIGFLLLVSLLVSTALTALVSFFHLGGIAIVGLIVHFLVSVLITGLLFAALFKVLPDVTLRWRDVLVGATLTAILFNLGQIAIGQYLGRTSVGSAYGAAGSLVIVLVWVYYSAAILFFGAQATQAFASRYGRGPLPPR